MRTTILTVVALLTVGLTAGAQEEETSAGQEAVEVLTEAVDARDSVIAVLTEELQAMKLREIVMTERLEQTGRSLREDSAAQAQRAARIDSLRRVTAGEAVVVDRDTLFILYAARGGVMPRKRADEAARKIRAAGERLVWAADTVYVFESELSSDVMCGDEVLVSLSDLDGLWENTSRQQLAHDYAAAARAKIEALHLRYGMQQKMKAVGLSVVIVVVQALLIWLTCWLLKRVRLRILRAVHAGAFRSSRFRLLTPTQKARLLLTTSRWAQALLILLQLLVSIPLIFAIFPETQDITMRLLRYVWMPLKDVLYDVAHYLPRLLRIVVIFFCFYYFVRAMRFVADSIEKGRVRIKGFYADWAMPTFQILRILAYAFMMIVIWPLLPYSDSVVFQGVSVFLGVVVSLGSTTIIGNMLSGVIITYMRPFRVGDYIEVGGTMGTVTEKTAFVTRIRTAQKVTVTVPNSSILTSQVSNYTSAARRQGIVVHTEVTIGYDVERETVERLLLQAATGSYGLLSSPQPFVYMQALEDNNIRYQLNAYTQRSHEQSLIYSELNKRIVDAFKTAGIELASPPNCTINCR